MKEAIKWISKRKDGSGTVPTVANYFDRSQSSVDNWLRTATAKGFLVRHKPVRGMMEGQMEGPGRPAVVFTITAKGGKWLADPTSVRAPKTPKAKAPKAKAPKAKAQNQAQNQAPKAPKAPKAKTPKAKDQAPAAQAKTRKPLTDAQRAAKNAKAKARRAKATAAKDSVQAPDAQDTVDGAGGAQ